MIRDKQGLTEQEFLSSYDAGKYPRPSVATDMAIFSITEKEEKNYRKLSEKNLSILLIQRGIHPFLDCWALPGGFVRPDETTEQAARRELREETGLDEIYMEQLYTFSEPNRDPRTWVMSCSYMALIDCQKVVLQAGDDADKVKWFRLSYNMIYERQIYSYEQDGKIKAITRIQQYELILTPDDAKESDDSKKYKNNTEYRKNNTEYKENNIEDKEKTEKTEEAEEQSVLQAIIQKTIIKTKEMEKSEYALLENDGLAFDHAKIIACAVERLRGKVEHTGLVLHLMPEEFTLTQLQQAYEVILGKTLLKPAFRRKIANLVEETDHYTENEGHRPSRFYRRKWEYKR